MTFFENFFDLKIFFRWIRRATLLDIVGFILFLGSNEEFHNFDFFKFSKKKMGTKKTFYRIFFQLQKFFRWIRRATLLGQLQETCTIDCLENQFFRLLLQPQIHQKWLVESFSCMKTYRAPPKIPSQFLRNFNFLKREKTTIFTCHNNCDKFNRLNTFEMGRKIFFALSQTYFFGKIWLPD